MNVLIVQFFGQNPGLVIFSAIVASVSTLNDRNDNVDLSLLRGTRYLTLIESTFGTPLFRMYLSIMSVVVLVANFVM